MTRIAVVTSMLLLGVVVASAQGTKTDPTLSKVAADFSAAVTANDAAKTAAHYTADATFMPPNEPAVQGRSNIQAWFQKHMDEGPATLKLEPRESHISGDLAYEAGTYTLDIKPKTGQPMSDKGKYIVILRKEGGAWKISNDVFNSDLPPAPPAKQ
jgi:uncharacterized protein (TIGR02246 family)